MSYFILVCLCFMLLNVVASVIGSILHYQGYTVAPSLIYLGLFVVIVVVCNVLIWKYKNE